MNKFLCLFLTVFLLSFSVIAQETPVAYKIYNSSGKEISWVNFIKDLNKKKDVVLFGELHDNKIGHWIQLETSKALIEKNEDWILGAEMIEFDQQSIVDEYFRGFIVQSSFEEDARLWNNYSDYKPLVELAKEENRKFVASNIPRRYARTVFYHGLDTLAELTTVYPEYMPSMPISVDTTLESYANLRSGMNMHGSGPMYLLEAQAIKDAVMAHNICVNIKGKKKILHFNGAYHSNNYEGIYVYLKEYCKPRVATISMAVMENCEFLEDSKGIADYIIITNKNFN